MKHILRAISVAAALAGVTAMAQSGGRGMGGPGGMSASMAKFFGDNKTFTATIEATMQNPSQGTPMTMEMTMYMLDGKSRTETDMSKIKGANMPPNALARMKQMGMDKSVNIVRPDKKASYVVFPGLTAYAEMMMTDKQAADATDNSKIEKTSLGKETVDGHPCEKNKLTVTDDNGQKHEVLVWDATDLKNFPVQMEINEEGNKVTMKYKDVKFEKPDAKLFEAPADYTKYSSYQSLMQGEMMKRAGSGGPGTPK